MIAIIDYGMANLRSVEKAIARVGGEPVITGDPDVVARAERVVLPGVGAFCACMTNLNARGLNNAVRNAIGSGKPFLGICVGLQMLFDTSSEMGLSAGLGILPGRVVRFFEEPAAEVTADDRAAAATRDGDRRELKVPHIGWNLLAVNPKSKLLCRLEEFGSGGAHPHPSPLPNSLAGSQGEGANAVSRVYFVHSYYPIPDDPTIISATSDYGGEFCCAVETRNIAAVQFHPEKSGAVGLRILRNFLSWNPVM